MPTVPMVDLHYKDMVSKKNNSMGELTILAVDVNKVDLDDSKKVR